ncbi:CadD family cadmium resistance transporter [Pediococcus parvulus]|uniref:CadD family cadmium resistance transporter n=1 Tax=Pediococcus parvulus TaxID=54062 RepID=UPI002656191E|nr:CadD family cadmium resistance transporter [Pediococcus sp.]
MLTLIFSGVTAYISTSIDYLVILMLIFCRASSKNERLTVYLGDLLGTSVLVIISLILAFVLHFIPATWLLGILGLIPIIMGMKLIVNGEENTDTVVNQKLNARRGFLLNVAMITIATCGADNIGIYVPFFVTLSVSGILIVLLTFTVMLTIFCYLGYLLVKVPVIAKSLEKYGRWITAAVYILLGLYIMFESGTFNKLFSIL